MKISAKTKFILIIGDPVDHSLSPAMHNSAYEHLGIDDQFVYLGSNVKIAELKKVVESMRVMDNFHGLICTIPHKIEVMRYLDWIDPVAKKIGAVNTIVKDKGVLKGYNTDWLGAVIPLENITKIEGKKIGILGAGGAARAIIYGLKLKGAKITIYNRTLINAEKLAKEFGCYFSDLEKLKEIEKQNIIVNATSVGMDSLNKKTPISTELIKSSQIIFDIVYTPFETQFIKEAKEKKAKVIYGVEMLLHQGITQFEILTGHKAPEKIMRRILLEKLKS